MHDGWTNNCGADTFKALFSKSGVQTPNFQAISPQALSAAQQLLACSAPAELRRIAMHGLALTILAAGLSPLCAGKRGVAA
jgi:AraC family transcriptional activator of pyochelin receptor